MSQDKYILKDIPGYERLYAITSDGMVWSYPKEWVGARGGKISRSGKWLKGGTRNRYPVVALTKNKTKKTIYRHTLVARTFLPNPNNLPEINHKNGNKQDSRLNNIMVPENWTGK